MKNYGVDSTLVDSPTKEDIAKAIKEKKGIVIGADAGVLWNDPQYLGGGHTVMVTNGDFDKNGNLTDVYINDTGTGEQGKKVPIDDFMKANKPSPGHDGRMVVTKDPIWK